MKSETPKNLISHLLSSALANLELTPHAERVELTVPDPRFGDYSTNVAMLLAKHLKISPPQVASQIIEEIIKIDQGKILSSCEAAGGFINFRLSTSLLLQQLSAILEQGDLYGCSMTGEGKTVLVEYFANNVAKPPHVGHLRSAVIGDCLYRILKSQGYKTISDTHIGDWGVQFGILLFAYKEYIKNGGSREVIEADPIQELNKLYVAMSARIDQNASLRELGKEEFVRLEKGDEENRQLWEWFVKVSLEDFERYRQLLDVLPFDHNLGESFYEDKMPGIIEDLKAKGLLVESQGAQIVNLEDKGLGVAIVIKSDGGTTYLLRDLATVKHRLNEFKIAKALYVVDNRQSHHFDQVFEIARRAGYLTEGNDICTHVDFGFMSLPEGAISTRKGTTVSLQNLVDEAQKRALEIIQQKNPELENKEAVAKLVALSAIKYFDLSHNRKTEIVFTWDKALSFEGNTGPYLQYTHARIHGILRKSYIIGRHLEGVHPTEGSQAEILHSSVALGIQNDAGLNEQELAVLRKLVKFPETVKQVSDDYLPNQLCNYLFELSQVFNHFYEECPVLQEPDATKKHFRLQLIQATAQVIANGLYLLGIEAPEEM